MQNTHRQMVLPFLADDPLYLREIREERVVAEVKSALEPVLRDCMVNILHDMAQTGFKERLEALVADAVKDSVDDIQAMFSDIRFLLQELLLRCADCHAPADWWKRNVQPDDDGEDHGV